MDIYEEMSALSQTIAASFPRPRFYDSCRDCIRLSRSLFSGEARVERCRDIIREKLENNYGHGLEHVEKVALEAGALAFLEAQGAALKEEEDRPAILAQVAGLLHDLRRGEKDHARSSARAAAEIIGEMSFNPEEQRIMVEAIANHEAFVIPQPSGSALGQLVSDVLYDADKFRWGPDNFTRTLWEMLRFSKAPLEGMVRRFPKGMKGIARIRETFRSRAGREYGPEFIDLGLQIGERIYRVLQDRYE